MEKPKRPRPVLSCVACRRKKLKCDRLLPCSQCERAERAEECTYNTWQDNQGAKAFTESPEDYGEHDERVKKRARAISASRSQDCSMQGGMREVKLGIVEDLQQRVETLERIISKCNHISPQPDSQSKPDREAMLPSCSGTLNVQGSRSKYHGQNHRHTLLSQVSIANEYTLACLIKAYSSM